jgi:hypothetical protein
MKTPAEMKEGIMKGIHRVYLWRQISKPVVRVTLFGAAILLASAFVSIPNIAQNLAQLHSIQAFLYFAFVAFVSTQFIVQLAVVFGALVFGFSVKDLIVSLRPKSALA